MLPSVMKLQRRLLCALLAALALLAAAGCGPADSGTPDVVHAAGATASATPASATLTRDPAATLTPGVTLDQEPTASPAEPTGEPTLASTPDTSPAPPPPATPTACLQTQGQFTSVNVASSVLTYSIATRIYLPPCYASSAKAYPVVYLIHGLNYDENQWERLGIGTAADRLIASGDIAPLIIVLPRDRGDLLLDPAFVADLVPYVDANYRTLASAGYRAIGGMSRGGGWSIHLGLRYTNVFGRVGAHSPAIFFGDETNVLKYIRAAAKNGTAPALYLDIGSGDSQNKSAVWLDQMFTAFRMPHAYVMPPGGHDEPYWAAHLDDYLRFYAAIWRPAPAPSATPIPSATRRFE
jgi:enterochelin esterase-like enzyme